MNQLRRGPLGLKHKNPVSKAVRDSAENEECTLGLDCCTHDPSTTVFCHLRFFNWAGVAQKPPDFLGVYACKNCHDELDRRADDAGWGFDDILRALGRTQIILHRKGLLILKGER